VSLKFSPVAVTWHRLSYPAIGSAEPKWLGQFHGIHSRNGRAKFIVFVAESELKESMESQHPREMRGQHIDLLAAENRLSIFPTVTNRVPTR
jgi:hypothetical protein